MRIKNSTNCGLLIIPYFLIFPFDKVLQNLTMILDRGNFLSAYLTYSEKSIIDNCDME